MSSRGGGGGDIYINQHKLSPLIVVVPTESAPEDQDSPVDQDLPDSVVDMHKLKFQLWANMVVVAITEFRKSVCNSYTKKLDLLALSQLSVYGIGCSGSGILGVYKLEMDLNKSETRFVTKLEVGHRDRAQAAALMDFTLRYYKRL